MGVTIVMIVKVAKVATTLVAEVLEMKTNVKFRTMASVVIEVTVENEPPFCMIVVIQIVVVVVVVVVVEVVEIEIVGEDRQIEKSHLNQMMGLQFVSRSREEELETHKDVCHLESYGFDFGRDYQTHLRIVDQEGCAGDAEKILKCEDRTQVCFSERYVERGM